MLLKTTEQSGYNSAMIFSPDKPEQLYHKRALWGWDEDNFTEGNQNGVFTIDGLKVGVRICFEVRFPEYFRELYRMQTDLNLVLFYDVAGFDNLERYELIKSHVRTRAVENVCHTLAVNTIWPYQTAPTALYDRSGAALRELPRNVEGLLVYDLDIEERSFGQQGIRQIADRLLDILKLKEDMLA